MYTCQTYYRPSTITIAYDAHGALGGASTWARGGNFSIGFASGAVASSITSCTEDLVDKLPTGWKITCMVAAGGLSAGVTATMAGGSFWEGVCNGLICSGLNHAMHLAAETVVGPDDSPEKNTKNKSPNKDNKVVDGSAVISGEAAIVKTAADWAAGGSKVEILNGISKWSKRLGFAGTVINVAVNVNKAVQGEISWASFTVRTVVTGVEVGIAAIPMVGPILSSMIVCYDIGGGFDNTLYNDNWIHPTKP